MGRFPFRTATPAAGLPFTTFSFAVASWNSSPARSGVSEVAHMRFISVSISASCVGRAVLELPVHEEPHLLAVQDDQEVDVLALDRDGHLQPQLVGDLSGPLRVEVQRLAERVEGDLLLPRRDGGCAPGLWPWALMAFSMMAFASAASSARAWRVSETSRTAASGNGARRMSGLRQKDPANAGRVAPGPVWPGVGLRAGEGRVRF